MCTSGLFVYFHWFKIPVCFKIRQEHTWAGEEGKDNKIMMDYWEKNVTYWKSRQTRRSLKSKKYIVPGYLYARVCLPATSYYNMSERFFEIFKEMWNIDPWKKNMVQTCFHEIVSTTFKDFSQGGKSIKDIMNIVLQRTQKYLLQHSVLTCLPSGPLTPGSPLPKPPPEPSMSSFKHQQRFHVKQPNYCHKNEHFILLLLSKTCW